MPRNPVIAAICAKITDLEWETLSNAQLANLYSINYHTLRNYRHDKKKPVCIANKQTDKDNEVLSKITDDEWATTPISQLGNQYNIPYFRIKNFAVRNQIKYKTVRDLDGGSYIQHIEKHVTDEDWHNLTAVQISAKYDIREALIRNYAYKRGILLVKARHERKKIAKSLVRAENQQTMKAIAERLRQHRLRKGLTVTEYAAYLELTKARYTAIEKAAADPSITTLLDICKITGMSLQYLVFGETQPPTTEPVPAETTCNEG